MHLKTPGCLGGLPREEALTKRLVVGLILIGIRAGKVPHGVFEGMSIIEITGNGYRISGAGVRVRERPRTEACGVLETLWVERGKVDRSLAVPELAHVVVARRAVDRRGRGPSQQEVARGLHEALALHHALTVRCKVARTPIELHDGLLSLFDLQDQWIVIVASGEQGDPGTSAHRAHAHDLACHIS